MDPSQTRRVVLLVDLHPLLTLEDPAHYAASVLASARRLLSFPPLSSSLFACKPFFSSLSPLLSTSRIHRLLGKSAVFLSFDRPSQTLDSLSRTLASLSCGPPAHGDSSTGGLGLPRASLTAESLFQLAYDCTWEPPVESPAGKGGIFLVRSNLVVMFSPLPRTSKCLLEFLDFGVDEVLLAEFRAKFFRIFSSVNDLFVSRDVHFSWLDVNLDSPQSGDTAHRQFIEKGIRGMGWSFCSTDAVALGSVLIPFGLMYPYIGGQVSSDSTDILGKARAELSLEISDASGRPLECKCCDLEMLILSIERERADILELFSQDSCNSIGKIQVKKVWRIDEQANVDSNVYASFLLHERPGDYKLDQKSKHSEGIFYSKGEHFFPDKILELFSADKSAVTGKKPVWQLLLNFLYRRSSCAFVSVSSSGGNYLLGILKPYTVQSAVMYVVGCPSTDSDMLKLDEGLHLSRVLSLSEPAVSEETFLKKKKNKKHLRMVLNLTCNSFHEYVFSQTDDIQLEVDLEDLYFVKGCKKSKKLRFLQCWMRQINKSDYSLAKTIGLEEKSETKEEAEERSVSTHEETAGASSRPVAEEDDFCQHVNGEIPMLAFLEDSQAFAENFSQKIDQVLHSEEVDLASSSECLVRLAIQFFSVKYGISRREDLASEEMGNCDAMVAAEVIKLLLKKPKDIAAKYKSSNALRSSSAIQNGTNKVREHELQILFRMEIFQSEISSSIEDSLRSKMVKDISLLLENIEFNLQGGMFAGESLIEFAGRTIKARYAQSLEDIVHRIYTEMEFLSFDEVDGEASVSLPHSNDESHGGEDNAIRGAVAAGTEGNRLHQNMNTVENSSHSGNTVQKSTDSTARDVLMEAQERRERARRFSHFTSWRQNLQRVWAPKQAKVDKPTLHSFHRSSRKRRNHVSRKDMVCETPMMGAQDPAVQQDDGGEGRKRSTNTSLSKALFHGEFCNEPA